MRLQLAVESCVTGPNRGFSDQPGEQWGGVDRPVIRRVGYLPKSRHLPVAHLVQDFARLFLALRIHPFPLKCREHSQRSHRAFWQEVKRLEANNQAVATERRNKPGDARGRDRTVRKRRVERVQIAQAALERAVYQLVTGNDRDTLVVITNSRIRDGWSIGRAWNDGSRQIPGQSRRQQDRERGGNSRDVPERRLFDKRR